MAHLKQQSTGIKSFPGGWSPQETCDEVSVAERYTISYDTRSGVIQSTTTGFWTIVDADLYFDGLGSAIEFARRHYGRALLLVDRRCSPVQSVEVAQRMQKANQELFRSDDRVAIVVNSNLSIMQIRRLISHAGTQAFLSCDAAKEWLQMTR